jgi:hypothetical protein
MEVTMTKYIVSFVTALYLFFSPIQALAVNPSDIIKMKTAGVSDKVIIAVVESNAIFRAIISVDEIIAMKSMPEIVLTMIENANRPSPELERQDSKDFALKRNIKRLEVDMQGKIKRAEMELELKKKELAVVSEHLINLMTNPEILKLVKAGKISSKDFADITKYMKQYARDEDSVDYREDKHLDIDIKKTYTSPSKKGYRKTHPDSGVTLEDLIIIKSID